MARYSWPGTGATNGQIVILLISNGQVFLLKLRSPAQTRPGGGAAPLEGKLLLLAGEQLCDVFLNCEQLCDVLLNCVLKVGNILVTITVGGEHSGDHHSERLRTEQQQGWAV